MNLYNNDTSTILLPYVLLLVLFTMGTAALVFGLVVILLLLDPCSVFTYFKRERMSKANINSNSSILAQQLAAVRMELFSFGRNHSIKYLRFWP